MKLLFILLYFLICPSLSAMIYDPLGKALDYARTGNFNGFKTIVTKYNLTVDKSNPESFFNDFRKPLIHSIVNSIIDIQNSKAMIEFCKQRNSNFATKSDSGLTVLHNAAFSKNVVGVQSLLRENSVHSVLYDQDNEERTVLSHANDEVYYRDGYAIIPAPRIATIAALKAGGYVLEKDPLYKTNGLPAGLKELWSDQERLNEELSKEDQKGRAQQLLKNEIRTILKEFGTIDIDVSISNFGQPEKARIIARASRYDEIKAIELDSSFAMVPYKKPIILHELGHHLLGHLNNFNHADLIPRAIFYEEFVRTEDEADDFAIKEDPEGFIKICQYYIDKQYQGYPRTWKELKARAEQYLKNK